MSIIRRSTGEYLNEDGTYTATWAPLDIDLDTNNETADWSVDVNLEFAGQYDIAARTFDSFGIRNQPVRRSFVVRIITDEAPNLTIDAPVITGSTVELTGFVIDDLGVSEVSLLLQNRDTLQYLRLDGSVGAAERFATTLSDPGDQETNWSETITGLPAGRWRVTVDAIDTSGQRDRSGGFFEVSEI